MAQNLPGPLTVSLDRANLPATDDQSLWTAIRVTTNSLNFNNYSDFLDRVFENRAPKAMAQEIKDRSNRVPFVGADMYGTLRAATEVFLMTNAGLATIDQPPGQDGWDDVAGSPADERIRRANHNFTAASLRDDWSRYRTRGLDPTGRQTGAATLPYGDIIRRKLGLFVPDSSDADAALGFIRERLTSPMMIELIWSYWHEEGMLAQTLNAVAMRFQNRRNGGGRDPLAGLEIDPLRPLSSLIWGFVQDEHNRLSVPRRAYEYDHHYGFSLEGRAVGTVRGADSRSKFLEAFHTLLFRCTEFYLQADDNTRTPDGFPLLNSLKEVHLLLTEGGHNQYGDLPWTARLEMMVMQWILARPEMREFLGGRVMVAYPEVWMDRVDQMKTLQGWTDTNITHFRDLADFGEKVLLAIRFGAWSTVILPQSAANWAMYWRPEIQGYVHAYRAATGVDLASTITETRLSKDRYLPPSQHLKQRLDVQIRARKR